MRLTELLSTDRVGIKRAEELESRGSWPGRGDVSKEQAIATLSGLLARGTGIAAETIERVLLERERLQSTGIGDGVAIPHGAMSEVEQQCAALLVVPDGLDFDAIDGSKVKLLFAVVGPKKATGEHLKTLARVSRLLRNRDFREQLIASEDPRAAYELIAAEEGGMR